LQAIALLLNYIKHTQQHTLTNIYKISYHAQLGMVLMDDITIKNLEIFSSSYEANEKYSLIGVIDQTKTTGGARFLRYLLTNPVHTLSVLQERQGHILRYQQHDHSKTILKALGETFDIHKLLSTILYRKPHPLPFIKLRTTLGLFLNPNTPSAALLGPELLKLGLSEEETQQLFSLWKELDKALQSDEHIKLERDFISDGYNAEIDKLRKIAYHSDELLLQYQQFLVQQTGVHNIKLKFVMNQGYFIELTTKDMPAFEEALSKLASTSSAPDHKLSLIRRQTLKDNQRYSSPYLEQLQQSILSAKDQLITLETEILVQLAKKI
jgi:DNA mismatch repair protein MutS